MKSHCTLTNVDQIKTRNLSRDRINVKYRVSNSVFNSKLKKKKKKNTSDGSIKDSRDING